MKKDNDPNHHYAREPILFKNYDYTTDIEGAETSPGGGFYSTMHQHKSVKDFIEKKRKLRKKALMRLLALL